MSLTNSFLAATVGLGLLGTGCATKKFVRNHVAPIDQRVSAAEKKSTEQGTQIDGLESGLSRTKEQVTDVDGRAKQAAASADKANAQAQQANTAAENARVAAENAKQFADQGLNRVESELTAANNYQMVANDNVLFASGRYQLTPEGKEALDKLAKNVEGKKHFVIEIEGFTDKTGPVTLNLELSQKRAEAVARYLTVERQIPLRSVHILGVGSSSPVADNKTRQGRSQNRRVEVRLFLSQAETTTKTVASAQ